MHELVLPLIEDGSEHFHATAQALAKACECSIEEAEHIVRMFMTKQALNTKWSSFTFALPEGTPIDGELEFTFNPDGTVTVAADDLIVGTVPLQKSDA